MTEPANNVSQPKPARISWSAAPMVFVVLPVCPSCGSPSYTSTRSESAGEGASTIKAICRECSAPFKICKELPEIGKHDF